uniref:G-protein coupled receptors family 1 profile domain-containing protein n=1 Tax=Naja naja TaxID=35670 RepID=A0A8C6YB43_NAJNA
MVESVSKTSLFQTSKFECKQNLGISLTKFYLVSRFAWNKFFILKMFFIGLIFPMMIVTFCYAHILNTLLKSSNAKNKTLFHTSFFADNCENLKRMNLALQLTETFTVAHCCVNPLIYAFASEKFKKYVINPLDRTVLQDCYIPSTCGISPVGDFF